jgi:hypothetical protein
VIKDQAGQYAPQGVLDSDRPSCADLSLLRPQRYAVSMSLLLKFCAAFDCRTMKSI